MGWSDFNSRFCAARLIALGACAAGILLAGPTPAQAQSYPSKPVRIICTFAAGGTTDVLARGVARQLSEIWGQQVVVENRAGANTQIGAEHVAKSAGDGYTLMVTSEGTFVMNPSLYEKLPYDAAKDFIPITTLVELKQVLIVSQKVPVSNIKELIALARKEPGKLTYGTTGLGSSSHLNMEMLQSMAQVKLTAVHYRGASQALIDMHGGHIDMIFAASGIVADQYRAGTLKILAVSSSHPRRRPAGPADHRRSRPAGFRRHLVVRLVRAARHAARDHRQDSHRRRQEFRERGLPQGLPRTEHARAQHHRARCVRAFDQRRPRALGQDHPRGGLEGKLVQLRMRVYFSR